MANYDDRLADYVDVAERIRQFRALYPQGSLQPADIANPYDIVNIQDKTYIVFTALAYRTPDDIRPGVGCAWEPFPGLTPYSKNSELMTVETSAWGRAIVAALAGNSKKIASTDEVRNRQTSHPAGDEWILQTETRVEPTSIVDYLPRGGKGATDAKASPAQLGKIRAMSRALGLTPPINIDEMTKRDAHSKIEELIELQGQNLGKE